MPDLEKYVGLSDKEVLICIEKDYGKEAAEHLKEFGLLTLNEAIAFRNKYLYDAFGIEGGPKCGQIGDEIGWGLREI